MRFNKSAKQSINSKEDIKELSLKYLDKYQPSKKDLRFYLYRKVLDTDYLNKNKEIVENNKITSKIEALSQTRNNKTSLALIAPKLKTISSEKPSTSNEVYLLSLNEVLHKDFNSFGIRRSN